MGPRSQTDAKILIRTKLTTPTPSFQRNIVVLVSSNQLEESYKNPHLKPEKPAEVILNHLVNLMCGKNHEKNR